MVSLGTAVRARLCMAIFCEMAGAFALLARNLGSFFTLGYLLLQLYQLWMYAVYILV